MNSNDKTLLIILAIGTGASLDRIGPMIASIWEALRVAVFETINGIASLVPAGAVGNGLLAGLSVLLMLNATIMLWRLFPKKQKQ